MTRSELHPIVRRFVEEAGSLTQSIGMGRALGQLFAYLYFSRSPRSLSDMQRELGISKGGASMCVRQLEQWGAARKIWVRGDRRDYYEANDWFGRMLKTALQDTVGKRLRAAAALVGELEEGQAAGAADGDGEGEFLRERIARLRAFQRKAEHTWNNPIVKLLLK